MNTLADILLETTLRGVVMAVIVGILDAAIGRFLHSALETVTFERESDGARRASGYFIKPGS